MKYDNSNNSTTISISYRRSCSLLPPAVRVKVGQLSLQRRAFEVTLPGVVILESLVSVGGSGNTWWNLANCPLKGWESNPQPFTVT